VEFSKRVIQLLARPPSGTVAKPVGTRHPSIAVLLPYTRQKESLQSSISGSEVSSSDGFQRRKADIIVLVTVRCYAPSNLDFLNDMRRLNIVITSAKCGVAIIGNTATLSGGAGAEHELDEVEKNGIGWLINACAKTQCC
jgi:superfamily I DNA and/or RNA helicase